MSDKDNNISDLSPEDLDQEFIDFFDSEEQIVTVTREFTYSIEDFRNGREDWTPEAIFEQIKNEAISDMRSAIEKWELRFTNENDTEIG